ncbi:MAG: shikimate kinase [Oscillospiraceae bacterium]|nr:shikimate kinase [Oscillospiraceae bacterium]
MNCGLLGRKLGHSYSKEIHAHLGAYSYRLIEKEPEELDAFFAQGDFTGLNVTMPYKKTVIPYLSQLSSVAEEMGAVNTIVRRADGSLIGHNTDYFGFQTMLKTSGVSIPGKKALVLGSGGAAVTAVQVLKNAGAEVITVSRTGENNYQNLFLHADAALIVNATPVGMYPNTGKAPLDVSQFPKLEGVLDLIYNPARTQLMLDAENLGIPCYNGLLMLVAQAKESAEWFTQTQIPDSKIGEIHRILKCKMENLILIGMPGCGKTTVGKLLSEKTGQPFIDADAYLENHFQKSIPDIFAQEGEEAFRLMETQVLEILGKGSGAIIATGGGSVTQERNYPLLHQNGTLFCLERGLDKLATEGRPLSKSGKLAQMYEARRPMYQRFADHLIDNNGEPCRAAEEILKIWEG